MYYITNQSQHINQAELRQANAEFLDRYASNFEFALTLTLKPYAKITFKSVDDSDYSPTAIKALDEDTLASTIRYFTANLTQLLFGNAAKHKNKQDWAKPLLFFGVEGLKTDYKPTHIHAVLGNVPEHKKEHIRMIVEHAWHRCDFGNKHICVRPYYSTGWNSYITKEIGFINNDALRIVDCTIPNILKV